NQLEGPPPQRVRGVQDADLRHDLAIKNIALRAVVDYMNVDVDVSTRRGPFEAERFAHLNVPPHDVVDAAALRLVGLNGHAPDTELFLRKRGTAQGEPHGHRRQQTRPSHRTPPCWFGDARV